MSHGEYLTSAGHLGVEERQDDRLVGIKVFHGDDPAELRDFFDGIVSEAAERDLSRALLKGIVTDKIMQSVWSDEELLGYMEVALPLQEFRSDSWLVYLAENHERRGQTDAKAISRDVRQDREVKKTPLQRVRYVANQGGNIDTVLTPDRYDELHELWGPTFGWGREGIEDLAGRLAQQQELNEGERQVWFSGSYNEQGEMVSAAMAERLVLPGADGPIDLVESTEWASRPDVESAGFVTAAIAALHAQVIHDLRDRADSLPVIYAECNFSGRADRAGYSTGLRIPPEYYARQILPRHISIGDGQKPEGGLRDFSFMFLPRSLQARDYAPDQVAAMMDVIRSGVPA